MQNKNHKKKEGEGWQMRGIELIMGSQGQWEALEKIAWEGDQLDQLGPGGRVGEKSMIVQPWRFIILK